MQVLEYLRSLSEQVAREACKGAPTQRYLELDQCRRPSTCWEVCSHNFIIINQYCLFWGKVALEGLSGILHTVRKRGCWWAGKAGQQAPFDCRVTGQYLFSPATPALRHSVLFPLHPTIAYCTSVSLKLQTARTSVSLCSSPGSCEWHPQWAKAESGSFGMRPCSKTPQPLHQWDANPLARVSLLHLPK